MLKEEAIDILFGCIEAHSEEENEALDMAIEALECEPSADGTLEIKVEDATKIGRVLISDDEHRGGLYYPDEYEPKGEPMKTTDYCDICKRDMCEFCVADNSNPYCVPSHYEIKQDEPQNDYPTEWCEHCDLWEDNKCVGVARCKSNIEVLKPVMSEDLISRKEAFEVLAEILDENHVPIWICDKLAFAIDALPSADRPKDGDLISRADAIETIELVDWYHQNKNKDMIHGANDDEHQAWYKAQDIYEALEAVPSADRPRGYWKDGKWCSVCGMPIATDVWGTSVDESEVHYCIECGAEMRGETNE